jgi:hypothetical protein
MKPAAASATSTKPSMSASLLPTRHAVRISSRMPPDPTRSQDAVRSRLKDRLPKVLPELQMRITQLAREGSPPLGLRLSQAECHADPTDGQRPDSPVRILYAQPASLVSNAVRADGSRNPAIRDDSSSSTMRRRPGFANAREFCAGRSGDPRASWVTYITAWEPRARACRPTDAKGGNPSPQDQRDVRGNRALLRQAFGQVGDASLRRSSKSKR